MDLSAVLPAFNEADNLERTVGELTAALAATGRSYEVLIVDDGSTDGTAAVAEALGRADPRVRLLRHARNQGYGAAVRTGFAASRGTWILLLDADGQFVPAELPRLLAAAGEGADFVLGYRVHRADPLHRRWFAALWRRLMAALLDVQVRDVNCAFKLLRGDLVRALPLESRGAFMTAELLARARRAGARFAEVPVSHRPRRAGRQTGGRPGVILRAFSDLFRLYWRLRSAAGGRAPAAGAAGSLPPGR